MTHDLWASLNNKILDYLSGVTLADMVENKRQNDAGNVSQLVFTPRRTCGTITPNSALSDVSTEEVAA
jgi:Rrf2 family iron-sulfur cluster assembly transcriptional regulator